MLKQLSLPHKGFCRANAFTVGHTAPLDYLVMPSREGEMPGANVFQIIWCCTMAELGDHTVLIYARGEEVYL